jgi:hypothetical protein
MIQALFILLCSNVISILYIMELKSIKKILEDEICAIHKFITDNEKNINLN